MSNHWFVGVAAVAAFIVSALYYATPPIASTYGAVRLGDAPDMRPWMMVAELTRNLVISAALAVLIGWVGASWREALLIAGIAWFGFVASQWAGAVMWEGAPLRLAMIHAGDWAIKLLVISGLVGAWFAKGASA